MAVAADPTLTLNEAVTSLTQSLGLDSAVMTLSFDLAEQTFKLDVKYSKSFSVCLFVKRGSFLCLVFLFCGLVNM